MQGGLGRAFKGQAVARANSKGMAILKGLTTLHVGGEELGILEDAILMVQVAMHNVSLVTVLSDRRCGSLIRIRENPEESGEKQRGGEHQAKNAVWWVCSL